MKKEKKIKTKTKKETKAEIIEKNEQAGSLKPEQSQVPEDYKKFLPAKPSYPNQLSLVLVYYRPLFPHMVLPLLIQKKIFRLALNYGLEHQRGFIMITLSYAESEKKIDDKKICKIGVLARIVKTLKNPNNKEMQVVFEIIGRVKIVSFLHKEPFLFAEVEHLEIPSFRSNDTIKAYCREILNNVREMIKMYPAIKEELNQYLFFFADSARRDGYCFRQICLNQIFLRKAHQIL